MRIHFVALGVSDRVQLSVFCIATALIASLDGICWWASPETEALGVQFRDTVGRKAGNSKGFDAELNFP